MRTQMKTIVITITGWLIATQAVVLAQGNYGVFIDPEAQGKLITDWGYDIKQANMIDGLTPAYANALFVEDQLTLLRVGIWGESDRPAHPGPGEIDTSYYVYDGEAGSLKMFTAMKNARDARPDVRFFCSKKSSNDGSMPDWTFTGGSTDPIKCARMFADYLRFWEHDLTRKSESFTFDVLGINNEGSTYARDEYWNHVLIIEELRRLSALTGTVDLIDSTHATHPVVTVPAGFTMPPLIIGPERWAPRPDELENILNWPGGPETLDLVGTHYYPDRRNYYDDMKAMVTKGGGRPAWHSETHWRNDENLDEVAEAEVSLATLFDCIDVGYTGFSWWGYKRTDFVGELKQAITTSTLKGRSLVVDDEDGMMSPEVEGTLITRAFRQGNRLRIWALNVTDTVRSNYAFNLLNGSIGGDVEFTRWYGEDGVFGSVSGYVDSVNESSFSATLPTNTITLFTLPYQPGGLMAHYAFDGDTSDSGGQGLHGTAFGAVDYVEGRVGLALDLNGVDTEVQIPRSVSNSFTIALWVRTDEAGFIDPAKPNWMHASGLVDGEMAGVKADFGMSLRGSNIMFGVGAPDTVITSTTDMPDGQWRHVAATRSATSGEMMLYINGKQEAQVFGPTGTRNAPLKLNIGSIQTGWNHFAGQIDDVRIYDRVLPEAEIQQLVYDDALPRFVETWESADVQAWVGNGTVQADNEWSYLGRDRTDWGIVDVGSPLNSRALSVSNPGSNTSSTDADSFLERPLVPEIDEWISLKADFMLHDVTSNLSAESRVYVCDDGRQNGYALLAISKNTNQSAIKLKVLSGGSSADVWLGQIGAQEVGVVYTVQASFKRLSETFAHVCYTVLKDGAVWQSGDAVVGGAPVAGAQLTKVVASQQKNALSCIDNIEVTVQPDLRDLHIVRPDFQFAASELSMRVEVPQLNVAYHIESGESLTNMSAEAGSSFTPDVNPWRIRIPLNLNEEPAKFFRVRMGDG